MYKLLYRKSKFIYIKLSSIRMNWYMFTGNNKKASDIITEHMKW
jgi:hypothetical protein